MNQEHVGNWIKTHPLSPIHVDCATAVMLKILDGKCKMRDSEKIVMTMLYDAVKTQRGQVLEPDLHDLIDEARCAPSEALKNLIYEKRLLAETVISRPVMKAFKATIRQQGLLDDSNDSETND
ncbi:MAG: hypothetical protein ACU836_09160 [Gammaproteobacteria bacterium]